MPNGMEMPDWPGDDAPLEKKVDWVCLMFKVFMLNAGCQAHAKRLRRLEITVATLIGGGGIVGGLVAKFLL